jgi:hypothetical protein
MLVPRSQRTLAQACRRAGLTLPDFDSPSYFEQLGEMNLRLLVEGIDHRGVGDGFWYCSMLVFAVEEIGQEA